MDIDQLQESWDQLGAGQNGAADNLQPLLKARAERAREPLRRMKVTALRQAVIMIILFAAAYTQIASAFRTPVALLYGAVILMFGACYIWQYRLLKRIEDAEPTMAMSGHIESAIRRLKGLLLFYRITSLALLVLTCAFLLWMRWTYMPLDFYDFPGLHLHKGQEALVILCWTIPTLLLMVIANAVIRYRTRNAYGRYIAVLQKDLDELKENRQ